MRKNEKIKSVQYPINNNVKRNLSKDSKKKNNSSMRINNCSPILTFTYSKGKNVIKRNIENQNDYISKNSNYEYILQKLLRYLKQKMSNLQYENTKIFLKKEIINLIQSNEININENKNDSISMILKSLSNRNPYLKIDKKIIESNILFTGNSSSLNKKDKYKNLNKKVNNKKLKLSYDFSNIISSNKTTVLDNNKKTEKKIINPFSKHKKFCLKPMTTRDLHSLYSIIKNPYSKKSENKKNKNYLNQTQSNSKSKNDSRSTSREYSSHHSNTFFKNITYTNRSDNLGKINFHNSKYFHNYTFSKNKKKNFNNNTSLNNNNHKNKITNLKPTQNNNKSILNKKLFSKIGNLVIPKKKNIISNNNDISNSINITKIFKTYENKKIINKTITQTNSNSSSRIKSYRNKKNILSSSKRPFSNKPIQSTIIKNLYESIKYNNSVKNEDMIKQIKNTIDDNLKVMFNFSYENFLSKESEHESRELSRENDLTFPYKYNNYK
jgi:hypothetical protein